MNERLGWRAPVRADSVIAQAPGTPGCAASDADTVDLRESHWVIDLRTDRPTVRAVTATAGRSAARRRRSWVVVGAVLLAIIVLSASVAWVNHQRGMGWQARALALERQLSAALSRATVAEQDAVDARSALTDARQRVRALRRLLEVSEADVADLESRLAAAADAKAQVEDDLLVDSRNAGAAGMQTAGLQAQLDRCRALLSAWLDQAPGAGADQLTWSRWLAEGEAVSSGCEEAAVGDEARGFQAGSQG